MEITKRLADFIVNTAYEDVPEEALELAKRSFLDTLGITLGGSVEEGPGILSRFIKESDGRPVASLVGQGFKSTVQNAALVNGTAGDIIGFSDISVINIHHPSVAVCPAIWSLAEQQRSAGKDAILAHIIGVEIADKIGTGVTPGFHQKGWHPLCVLGTFGATAAAGKLFGLDSITMANALGIAGEQASGIRGSKGTMSKAYGAGRAAENGVTAARLAQMGFTGSTTIMETRDGFLQTFGDGADGMKILENLGNPFEFIAPGITLKPYPSCTCTHTAISGVLSLRKEHEIVPEEVESVECSVTPAVADILKFPNPQSKFEAKYSMQFCVATALIEGKVVITSFSDKKLANPRIRELMKRITMTVSPELAKLGYNPDAAPFGCTVTIRLKNGEERTCRVDKGPWEPETPPSWDELIEKYRSCAELVLKPRGIEESIEIVRNLEKAENLCRLMDIVRA